MTQRSSKIKRFNSNKKKTNKLQAELMLLEASLTLKMKRTVENSSTSHAGLQHGEQHLALP
jgi:hypothetical protein